MTTLADVAKIQYGKGNPKTEGEVPVVGSGGTYDHCEKPLIDYPSVIIGRKGSIGNSWYYDQPSWPSDTSFYLDWQDENINPKYVYFALVNNPPKGDKGGPKPSLQKPELEKYKFFKPSKPEQDASVYALNKVLRAKEAREAELALERERKAALMAHLFTHGTRGEPRKQTEIGEMPENWDVKRIVDHGCFRVRTSFPTFKKLQSEQEAVDGESIEVLAIKVSDMNMPGNEKWINNAANVFSVSKGLESKFLKGGSIIFPKRGAAIATNKKRISSDYTTLDPNLIALEFNEETDVNFIFHFFETLDLKTLQDSTPVPQLNKHNVENVVLPLPLLDEQKAIGEVLAVNDKVISSIQSEIALLDELFHSMLDELMSGKLSVQPLLETQTPIPQEEAA